MASKEVLLDFLTKLDVIIHDKQTWFYQELNTWNHRGELSEHYYTTEHVLNELYKDILWRMKGEFIADDR